MLYSGLLGKFVTSYVTSYTCKVIFLRPHRRPIDDRRDDTFTRKSSDSTDINDAVHSLVSVGSITDTFYKYRKRCLSFVDTLKLAI